MGLGTCLIGYFVFAVDYSENLRRMLQLPEGRKAEVALVLGHPQFRFRRVVPRRKMELVWKSIRI